MAGRVKEKVAVITGGANGIGASAARLLAAEGAHVILVDLDEESLRKTSAEIGAQASYLVGDITEKATAKAYVAKAQKKFGRLDIALLNAGVEGPYGTISEVPVASFDKVMAVNVRGVWLGLASVMPAMKDTGGSIVITSSIGGLRGRGGWAAYTASKHAVIGLMRSAAMEGAPHRVRVNTVNPAPIHTRMIQSIDKAMGVPADNTGQSSARLARIPLHRYGDPDEVAAMMLFLASDESSYCTGGVYVVDGGVTAT